MGVTYIEIMLSIAIIGFIVVSFAQLFMKNNIALNQAKMSTLATSWAADKIEEVKSFYYADIATGTWTSDSKKLGENINFTQIVTVNKVNGGLKEIVVKVTWETLEGQRENRLVSYAADYSAN